MNGIVSKGLAGLVVLALWGAAGCQGKVEATLEASPTVTHTATKLPATTTPPPPTSTSTPQALAKAESLGPELESFPAGYNPLSGLPVVDPAWLKTPAMLLSISHFPPVARPQAGLSFAPWVFEFYITEGATRFLSVFFGTQPKPETLLKGDCAIRAGVFEKSGMVLGNRVWFDENENGRQEAYEAGVGGICVNLYDEAGKLLEATTSDLNGFYGFNIKPGRYQLEFIKPQWLEFTRPNVGDENGDSDAALADGRAQVELHADFLHVDAGFLRSGSAMPTEAAGTSLPQAEVGPIRSGRLVYADIVDFFHNSCLVYAFASKEVRPELPTCAMVAHEDAGGGSLMSLERFINVAGDNQRRTGSEFNYSGNLFTDTPPKGGVAASEINVYVSQLNQSAWHYDPLYGGWLRFVDEADPARVGELHQDVDRLNGRPLYFENVIVLFAEVDVISPTNLDIHLEQGDRGAAILFRDGMKYDIRWSTRSGEYEKKTGFRRPIQFQNLDGSPAWLKPGRSWIFIASPFTTLSEEDKGIWQVHYYAPAGSR